MTHPELSLQRAQQAGEDARQAWDRAVEQWLNGHVVPAIGLLQEAGEDPADFVKTVAQMIRDYGDALEKTLR